MKKKYLIQFFKKVEEVGEGLPTLIPVEGLITEMRKSRMTDLFEETFEKFPFYYMAIVSTVEDSAMGKHKFTRFAYVVINEGWNGKVFGADAMKMPTELFEMSE